jgi:hypothetical protein
MRCADSKQILLMASRVQCARSLQLASDLQIKRSYFTNTRDTPDIRVIQKPKAGYPAGFSAQIFDFSGKIPVPVKSVDNQQF